MDRDVQIEWLKMTAAEIRSGRMGEGTPTEQVDYLLDEQRMPAWFDNHDRDLLIEFVTA